MLRKPKATLTQSKLSSEKGRRSARIEPRGDDAIVDQTIAARLKHRTVDVGQNDTARFADTLRKKARDVARAACNVEHAVASAARGCVRSAYVSRAGAGRAT